MTDIDVWSYGGGWQSVAMGVLIREGVIERPDLAVIADTGRERRSTWDYMRNVMQPYLDPIGLTIEVAPHTLATKDLYAPDGLTLLPAFTGTGRLPTYCSGEWKREVINRWLRSKGVVSCDCWIGFSIDEMARVSAKDRRLWLRHRFPLIDRFINRKMCEGIIRNAGLPMPSKSRCWMCPHQTAEEWAEVADDAEEWAAAVALDEAIRENDPDPGKGGLYLHHSRKPLAMLADGIQPPSMPCENSNCWT
jgi:hypothetical protein